VTQALASIGEESFETTILQDAHSLFWNSLITSGIVGTALWIAFFTILLVKAFRKIKREQSALLVILGICIYLAQGLVNGPQILTTPIFLVELGIFCAIL
jgi:O-antigen ligase